MNLLKILRERGPLTAQALADIVYPDGDGFIESWDLAASEKIEMDLRHLGHAVEVVGQVPSEYGGTEDLWGATTAERADELRAESRHARAAWLWRTRGKIRSGSADAWDVVAFGEDRAWAKIRRDILLGRAPERSRQGEAEAFNADRKARLVELEAHKESSRAEIEGISR